MQIKASTYIFPYHNELDISRMDVRNENYNIHRVYVKTDVGPVILDVLGLVCYCCCLATAAT